MDIWIDLAFINIFITSHIWSGKLFYSLPSCSNRSRGLVKCSKIIIQKSSFLFYIHRISFFCCFSPLQLFIIDFINIMRHIVIRSFCISYLACNVFTWLIHIKIFCQWLNFFSYFKFYYKSLQLYELDLPLLYLRIETFELTKVSFCKYLTILSVKIET